MKTFILPAAVCLLGAGSLHAAIATWSAIGNVTADTDVNTLGTLVQALHFGTTTDCTINGVTFTGQNSGVAGWTGYATGMNNGITLGTIGASYKNALDGCVYTGGFVTANYTLSSLTIGETYQFQVWINDLRDASPDNMMWDSGASTPSVTFSSNNNGTPYAQFVTGTFTADATSQTLRLSGLNSGGGNAGPIMNMFQLRDITAVPEPATYGLLGAGALAGIAFLRRRRSDANRAG